MNPKIEKIASEIEKTKTRIAASQVRLAELEQQKTDLENTDIVNLFRSVDVPPADLAGFIRAFKERQSVAPGSYRALPEREVAAHEE